MNRRIVFFAKRKPAPLLKAQPSTPASIDKPPRIATAREKAKERPFDRLVRAIATGVLP